MKRQSRRGKTEYRNDRGAALMVAVVLIGILMVFTFSLLLVTYTLYSSQNKKAASKRNAEAANTLSLALTTELTDPEAQEKSELWRYLRFNLYNDATWPYYAPDATYGGHGEKEAFRYFTMDYNFIEKYFGSVVTSGGSNIMEGFPGSVKLCIYWRLPEAMETAYNSTPVELSTVQDRKNGLRLYVRVICETASQTYMVTNQYTLAVGSLQDDLKKKSALESLISNDVYNPMHFLANTDINTDEDWKWDYDSRE